jgi:hypothetical protein
MDERTHLQPALAHIDEIENALTVIRTLAALPSLLDEATLTQIVVILSVIDDYANRAQIDMRNLTVLIQSL